MTPEEAAAAVRLALSSGPKTLGEVISSGIAQEDAGAGLARLDALGEVLKVNGLRWRLIGQAKYWPQGNTRSMIAHHEIQIAAHQEVLRALREPGSVPQYLVDRAISTIAGSRVYTDGQQSKQQAI